MSRFAEIYSGYFSAGCRVFNVSVQGTTAFSNLDVFAQAGANAVLEKSTTASVTNGTLTIGFGSIAQNPIISAIDVSAFQSATDEPVIMKNRFNSGQKLVCSVRFQDVSSSSAAQGRLDDIRIVVLAYEEYLRSGRDLTYPPCSFDSVQVWKSDVQQNQVWLQFFGFLHRL